MLTTVLDHPTGAERRTAQRFRISSCVTVFLGRTRGSLVDLSAHGARIHHESAVRLGEWQRLVIHWGTATIAVNARVLASRLVALGVDTSVPPMYESRLRFTYVAAVEQQRLNRLLATLESEELRRCVENLHGTYVPAPEGTLTAGGAYIQCVPANGAWKRKATPTPAMPSVGFVVPANVTDHDLRTLCDTWERLDEDGRHLLKLIAARVCGTAA